MLGKAIVRPAPRQNVLRSRSICNTKFKPHSRASLTVRLEYGHSRSLASGDASVCMGKTVWAVRGLERGWSIIRGRAASEAANAALASRMDCVRFTARQLGAVDPGAGAGAGVGVALVPNALEPPVTVASVGNVCADEVDGGGPVA
mmetsp:Transcript_7617/g.13335  ORF Transcript_7617/g.13335 Transcript_7617/m.13335 type:complete len:146 (+) Transcript_7617:4017-4454(+)